MSQYIFTLAIILLGLTATQVSSFVHHKDVVMIQRRLAPTDRCLNTTVHPTGFSDCPPVPFPYLDDDFETEKTNMDSLGKAKPALGPECYAIATRLMCIMVVSFCSTDGYIVGFYNYDICVKLLKCGEHLYGGHLAEDVCYDMTADYSKQLYNGTDDFTYEVMEEKKQISSATPPSSTLTTDIIISTLSFQLFVINYL